jgi:hypothetical protein
VTISAARAILTVFWKIPVQIERGRRTEKMAIMGSTRSWEMRAPLRLGLCRSCGLCHRKPCLPWGEWALRRSIEASGLEKRAEVSGDRDRSSNRFIDTRKKFSKGQRVTPDPFSRPRLEMA